MAASAKVLLLIHLWAVVQAGLAAPLMEQEEPDRARTRARTRVRRCACSNQQDSECHYFCHLDIIWINTPSKMTLYGLGSSLARRRRSAGRCACAITADQTCSAFCRHSVELPSSDRSKIPRPNPLIIHSAVAGAPRSTQEAVDPDGREASRVWGGNA